MGTLLLIALATAARAQDAPDPPAPPAPDDAAAAAEPTEAAPPAQRRPLRVAVRGIAETWSDAGIGTVYASGGLFGGIGVVAPLVGPLSLDVEVAYRRLYTDDGAESPDDTLHMEIVPVSLVVEYVFDGDASPVEGFVGLGPALATYREHHPPDATGIGLTGGAKISLEPRFGLRFDTGLVQPRMAPVSPVQGVDVELYGARRLQMPGGQGFDLDAWRGGLGLAFRI